MDFLKFSLDVEVKPPDPFLSPLQIMNALVVQFSIETYNKGLWLAAARWRGAKFI